MFFGGGLIVDLIKHSKLSKATDSMNEINFLMRQLRSEFGKH